MPTAEKLRLFIALPLELPPRLQALTRALSSLPGLKPIQPNNYHLTLRFLGDTPAGQIEPLSRILAGTVEAWRAEGHGGPLALRFSGLGAFPPRGPPRVLWAGLAGEELAALDSLASALEDKLAEGGFGRADKPFRAHLTLARVKHKSATKPVRELTRDHSRTEYGEVKIAKLVLFSSQLTPKGPIYTAVHTEGL